MIYLYFKENLVRIVSRSNPKPINELNPSNAFAKQSYSEFKTLIAIGVATSTRSYEFNIHAWHPNALGA